MVKQARIQASENRKDNSERRPQEAVPKPSDPKIDAVPPRAQGSEHRTRPAVPSLPRIKDMQVSELKLFIEMSLPDKDRNQERYAEIQSITSKVVLKDRALCTLRDMMATTGAGEVVASW